MFDPMMFSPFLTIFIKKSTDKRFLLEVTMECIVIILMLYFPSDWHSQFCFGVSFNAVTFSSKLLPSLLYYKWHHKVILQLLFAIVKYLEVQFLEPIYLVQYQQLQLHSCHHLLTNQVIQCADLYSSSWNWLQVGCY